MPHSCTFRFTEHGTFSRNWRYYLIETRSKYHNRKSSQRRVNVDYYSSKKLIRSPNNEYKRRKITTAPLIHVPFRPRATTAPIATSHSTRLIIIAPSSLSVPATTTTTKTHCVNTDDYFYHDRHMRFFSGNRTSHNKLRGAALLDQSHEWCPYIHGKPHRRTCTRDENKM